MPKHKQLKRQGAWITCDDEEIFRGHFYRPDIDVDLYPERIRHTGRFPRLATGDE